MVPRSLVLSIKDLFPFVKLTNFTQNFGIYLYPRLWVIDYVSADAGVPFYSGIQTVRPTPLITTQTTGQWIWRGLSKSGGIFNSTRLRRFWTQTYKLISSSFDPRLSLPDTFMDHSVCCLARLCFYGCSNSLLPEQFTQISPYSALDSI